MFGQGTLKKRGVLQTLSARWKTDQTMLIFEPSDRNLLSGQKVGKARLANDETRSRVRGELQALKICTLLGTRRMTKPLLQVDECWRGVRIIVNRRTQHGFNPVPDNLCKSYNLQYFIGLSLAVGIGNLEDHCQRLEIVVEVESRIHTRYPCFSEQRFSDAWKHQHTTSSAMGTFVEQHYRVETRVADYQSILMPDNVLKWNHQYILKVSGPS